MNSSCSSNVVDMNWRRAICSKVVCLTALATLFGCTPVESNNKSESRSKLSCQFGINSTMKGVLLRDRCFDALVSKATDGQGDSFDAAVRHCLQMHNSENMLSEFSIEDLRELPLEDFANSSLRILLGVRLLLNGTDASESYGSDISLGRILRIPMAYSNGTVAGKVDIHFPLGKRNGLITFPHFPLRLQLKASAMTATLEQPFSSLNRLCVVVEVKRNVSYSYPLASLSNCDNSDAWDVAFCEFAPQTQCRKMVKRECVWEKKRNSCFWQPYFSEDIYEYAPSGSGCPGEIDEPCTCTHCEHTAWTSWSTFEDPIGTMVAVRYRPFDFLRQWDCNVFSGVCCTELAILSPVTFPMNEKMVLAMVQCLNGGYKVTPGSKCKCPKGSNGLFCEIDFDDCAHSICLNGASCRDHLNGYECICQPEFYGEYCELRRGLHKAHDFPSNWTIVYVCILLPIVILLILSMFYFASACSESEGKEEPYQSNPVPFVYMSRLPNEGNFGQEPVSMNQLANRVYKREQEVLPLNPEALNGSAAKRAEINADAAVLKFNKLMSESRDGFGTSSERRRLRNIRHQRAGQKRKLPNISGRPDLKRRISASSSVKPGNAKYNAEINPSAFKVRKLEEDSTTVRGPDTDAAKAKVSTTCVNKNLSVNHPLRSEEVSTSLNFSTINTGGSSGTQPMTHSGEHEAIAGQSLSSNKLEHPLADSNEAADGPASLNKTLSSNPLQKEEEMAVSLQFASSKPVVKDESDSSKPAMKRGDMPPNKGNFSITENSLNSPTSSADKRRGREL
uniref:EGF-like domain-containing protein n=1 Tax=Trichuris muris TaxID=70415 RepID=A0A5S6R4Z1_TRIMR